MSDSNYVYLYHFAEKYSYWAEHPAVPLRDWQYEVSNGDTRVGYWEFVAAQMGLEEI